MLHNCTVLFEVQDYITANNKDMQINKEGLLKHLYVLVISLPNIFVVHNITLPLVNKTILFFLHN